MSMNVVRQGLLVTQGRSRAGSASNILAEDLSNILGRKGSSSSLIGISQESVHSVNSPVEKEEEQAPQGTILSFASKADKRKSRLGTRKYLAKRISISDQEKLKIFCSDVIRWHQRPSPYPPQSVYSIIRDGCLFKYGSEDDFYDGKPPQETIRLENARVFLNESQLEIHILPEEGKKVILTAPDQVKFREWEENVQDVACRWGAVQKVTLEHELAEKRRNMGQLWEMAATGITPNLQKKINILTLEIQEHDSLLADVTSIQEELQVAFMKRNRGKSPKTDLFPSSTHDDQTEHVEEQEEEPEEGHSEEQSEESEESEAEEQPQVRHVRLKDNDAPEPKKETPIKLTEEPRVMSTSSNKSTPSSVSSFSSLLASYILPGTSLVKPLVNEPAEISRPGSMAQKSPSKSEETLKQSAVKRESVQPPAVKHESVQPVVKQESLQSAINRDSLQPTVKQEPVVQLDTSRDSILQQASQERESIVQQASQKRDSQVQKSGSQRDSLVQKPSPVTERVLTIPKPTVVRRTTQKAPKPDASVSKSVEMFAAVESKATAEPIVSKSVDTFAAVDTKPSPAPLMTKSVESVAAQERKPSTTPDPATHTLKQSQESVSVKKSQESIIEKPALPPKIKSSKESISSSAESIKESGGKTRKPSGPPVAPKPKSLECVAKLDSGRTLGSQTVDPDRQSLPPASDQPKSLQDLTMRDEKHKSLQGVSVPPEKPKSMQDLTMQAVFMPNGGSQTIKQEDTLARSNTSLSQLARKPASVKTSATSVHESHAEMRVSQSVRSSQQPPPQSVRNSHQPVAIETAPQEKPLDPKPILSKASLSSLSDKKLPLSKLSQQSLNDKTGTVSQTSLNDTKQDPQDQAITVSDPLQQSISTTAALDPVMAPSQPVVEEKPTASQPVIEEKPVASQPVVEEKPAPFQTQTEETKRELPKKAPVLPEGAPRVAPLLSKGSHASINESKEEPKKHAPVLPKSDSSVKPAPVLPKSDSTVKPAPVLPKSESAVKAAPVLPKSDSALKMAPMLPKSDSAVKVAPILPKSDSQTKITPNLPKDESQSKIAPTLPKSESQTKMAPVLPKPDQTSKAAPVLKPTPKAAPVLSSDGKAAPVLQKKDSQTDLDAKPLLIKKESTEQAVPNASSHTNEPDTRNTERPTKQAPVLPKSGSHASIESKPSAEGIPTDGEKTIKPAPVLKQVQKNSQTDLKPAPKLAPVLPKSVAQPSKAAPVFTSDHCGNKA